MPTADAVARLAAQCADPSDVVQAQIDEVQAGKAQLGLDEHGESWIRAVPAEPKPRRFLRRR